MSRVFTDQCGYKVGIEARPGRIVSLVPSQTELLYDLGIGDRLVGITKFCVHPAQARREKTVIGGTKYFHHDVIEQLAPDLIIGNKEENYQQGIEQLQRKFPVWLSDIYSLADAFDMIRALATITDTERKASGLMEEITKGFNSIRRCVPLTALYLIWKKPWMAAASQTFIDHMITEMGLINCLSASKRYPEITEDQIKQLNPQVIFLSSEPFPFNERHAMELRGRFPSSKVMLVDGEMFSWYGSRLRYAPAYFNSLPLPRQ